MHSATEKSSWDFAPVFDFISTLSGGGDEQITSHGLSAFSDKQVPYSARPLKQPFAKQSLGNFDKIWAYLEQPNNVPPPVVPPPDRSIAQEIGHGTIQDLQHGKGVKWRDETEGGDLADNEDANLSLSILSPTKQQRKKERRRQRKEAYYRQSNNQLVAPESSENDLNDEPKTPPTVLDRRAIIYQILGNFDKRSKSISKGASPRSDRLDNSASSHVAQPPFWWQGTPPGLRQQPSQYAVASTKKSKLLTKLDEQFIEERQYLQNLTIMPSAYNDQSNPGTGLHIFVDASNVSSPF